MLRTLIPLQQRVLPRGGEILDYDLRLYPGQRFLPGRRYCERTLCKLYAIVIGSSGVLSIAQVAPIPDGYKADLRTGAGTRF